MHDVSLENAVLLWTPAEPGAQSSEEFAIIDIEDYRNSSNSYERRYMMSLGAVFADWKKFAPQRRLLQLYIELMHAIFRDRISPDAVVKACYCIPEFRDTLAEDALYKVEHLLGICE